MKNKIVVLSGILVLLATATIAAGSYNLQTAKAISSRTDNFGQLQASDQATSGSHNPRNSANGNGITANSPPPGQDLRPGNPTFGGIVSCYAKNGGQCT
jgi:hypothetical protein